MKSRLFTACTLAAAAVLGLLSGDAHAQHFSFSIGHGHHHGHHHHHWCHDPFWCGPHWDYVYIAPPPVVRREIRYVQPVERVIETRVESAPAATVPRSTSLASRPAAGQPLQIWNAGGQRLPVAFVVDGQEVTLHDGQSHTFYGSGAGYAEGARLVEFDRGGDFGIARRSLTGSQYEFVITSDGWDLVSRGGPVATAERPAPKNELPTRR